MINLKLNNPVTRVGLALLILTVPLSQSRAENLITSQLMPVLETACGVVELVGGELARVPQQTDALDPVARRSLGAEEELHSLADVRA